MYLNFRRGSTWFILIVDLVMIFLVGLEMDSLFYLPAHVWRTENPYALIFVSLLIGVFIIGGQWAYWSDHKDWNGGMCKYNGLRWVLKDRDSQGGRLYQAGNKSIWISYPVDK